MRAAAADERRQRGLTQSESGSPLTHNGRCAAAPGGQLAHRQRVGGRRGDQWAGLEDSVVAEGEPRIRKRACLSQWSRPVGAASAARLFSARNGGAVPTNAIRRVRCCEICQSPPSSSLVRSQVRSLAGCRRSLFLSHKRTHCARLWASWLARGVSRAPALALADRSNNLCSQGSKAF